MSSTATQAPLVYPRARRDDVADVFHGERVADPYRWLEQGGSPETQAWTAAQNALTEMRSLIQELHPHSETEEGLVPALRRLVAKRQLNDGILVDLQVQGEHRLPAHIEAELFRIAQEALNNVVKHAHADHAVIVLDLENASQVLLRIEDAGVGFDPAQARLLPGHLGLTSMHERVEALGGMLTIDSHPGAGTRVYVEVPWTETN